MSLIQNGDADMITLDAADVYVAGKYVCINHSFHLEHLPIE